MKSIISILTIVVLIFVSCFPLSIAPNYKDGKIVRGNKFTKIFRNQNVFAFNDPKEANEFYEYINHKFQLIYDDDLGNVRIHIEKTPVFLSFYEMEKSTKTYNLLPIVIDGMLGEEGAGPVLENHYTSRKGNWYIVMTLTDSDLKDCLNEEHPLFQDAVYYLQTLRNEYLTTTNYNELLFK